MSTLLPGTDLDLFPLVLGGNVFGWSADEATSFDVLDAFVAAGGTMVDSADAYARWLGNGGGESETIIGSWLAARGNRDSVLVATKVGKLPPYDNLRPESIRAACDDSLRRLGTDYIDLLQFHANDFPADQALPVRDTLEQLVAAGKIRAYGWSTDFVDRAAVFAEGAYCSTIQHQLNVLDDAPDMIAFCERMGLASINRGPLAMGLLTGKFSKGAALPDNDVRGARSPEWMKYFVHGQPSPEFAQRLDAVLEVLTSGGRTLAQGSLAWIWARSPNTVPIPGFRTVAQVEDNAGALDKGPLTAEQMAEVAHLLGQTTL